MGSFVDCRWRNGEFRNAKIIECRANPSGVHDYYVHYIGCEDPSTSVTTSLCASVYLIAAASAASICRMVDTASGDVDTDLYAHAADNRRLDEWVTVDRLNLATVEPEDEIGEDGK